MTWLQWHMDHDMAYRLAFAAAEDAANRSMRKAGRKAWNEDDWNVGVATFDRLCPIT